MASEHTVSIVVKGIDEATKIFQYINKVASKTLKHIENAVNDIPDIDIDTDIDIGDARKQIDKIEKEVKSIPDIDIEGKIEENKIQRSLDRIENAVEQVPDIDIDTKLDSKKVQRELDSIVKEVRSIPDINIDSHIESNSAMRQIDRIEDAVDNIPDVNIDTDKAEKELKELGKTAKQTEKQVDDSAKGMMDTFKKLGGIIAGVFALDKMKDFSVSAIEASASAQALQAQFEQVFKDTVKEAQRTIDSLGKDFGMLPNRIKPAFTTMTSMFMGLGLDTKRAMKEAETAVTLVADAAAFYDMSFEDANSALNSFIKGNYEGGEAIGLFANETQLAAWATRNLGLEWKELDEAGKQIARLEYARIMQELAGATGQARRESEGYENQLGNLRQAWQDFKAAFAEPALEPTIKGMMAITNFLQKINMDSLYTAIKNTSAVLAGLLAGFVAFKSINWFVDGIKLLTTLMIAYKNATLMATLAQLGFDTKLLTSPITWVSVAIGILITAILLLAFNWEKVSDFLTGSWSSLEGTAMNVFGNISNFLTNLWDGILEKGTGAISKLQNMLDSFLGSTLAWKIKTVFLDIKEAIQEASSGDLDRLLYIISQFIPTIIGFLIGGIPGLVISASRIMQAIAQGMNQYAPKVYEAFLFVIETILSFMAKYYPKIIEAGINVIVFLINGFVKAIPYIYAAIFLILENILTFFAEVYPIIMRVGIALFVSLIEGLLSALPMMLEAGILILVTLIEGIAESIPLLIETGIQMLNLLIDTFVSLLPEFINAGIFILFALIDGLFQVMPQLLEATVTIALTIAMGLIKNAPKIIEAGIKILLALIVGIFEALPNLLLAIVELLIQLVMTIGKNLPLIISAGAQILWALISGIIQIIPELIKLIGRLILDLGKEIINNVPEMVKAGADLIKGLWKGITSVRTWLIKKIKGFVGDVTEWLKDFFGIKLPSVLMEVEVGRFLPLGIVEGVLGMKNQVLRAMDTVSDWLIPDIPTFAMEFAGYDRGQIFYEKPTIQRYGAYREEKSDDKGLIEGLKDILYDIFGKKDDSRTEHPMDIHIHVNVDGREVARATAPYMDRELGRRRIDRTRAEGDQYVYL